MRDRRLLWAGLALVAAGLVGMALSAPAGGWWGNMHSGPMMGTEWWGEAPTPPEPPVAGAEEVSVEATEFAFDPSRLELIAGEAVNLALVNRGALLHDLTFPDLGIHVVARPGERVTTAVEVQREGEYRFVCTVPGHAEAGMLGVLAVAGPG